MLWLCCGCYVSGCLLAYAPLVWVLDLLLGMSTPLVICGCFYVMLVGYVVCMFDVLFWLLGLLVCVVACILVVDFVQLRWVRLVGWFTSWVSGVCLVAEVLVVFEVGL